MRVAGVEATIAVMSSEPERDAPAGATATLSGHDGEKRTRSTFLAGDVGATHTRLALFSAEGHAPLAHESYPSEEHAGLDEIVAAFIAAHPAQISSACFGVAGPVRDGHVRTTNLAWPVDGDELARRLGVSSVSLINDLAANAYGITELTTDDLETLNPGEPAAGAPMVVISAGTGLGEAGVLPGPDGFRVVSTEGGHTDFGPRSETEVRLYQHLVAEDSHVSYERVCSGIGLLNVYRFLRGESGAAEPAWLAAELAQRDAGAAISRAALAHRDAVCAQALDMMVSIYGAEAGNLALKYLATGGVYVGGGIAPRILPKLRDGAFMRAFAAKGRFESLLRAIPVHVILNDDTALLGAAHYARSALHTTR
jgi:glucokinase